MRNTYLVCYDIAEDKRRDRVFKVCKNHGEHLQFSVFECDLNRDRVGGLAAGTGRRSSCNTEDQVLFVSLGPSEGRGDRVIAALGKPYESWTRHVTWCEAPRAKRRFFDI